METKIVDSAPAATRHILVVNAGDGRLARALLEKCRDAHVSVVTIQEGMLGYVDDFAARTDKPWDVAWHEAQVAAHGAFDYVVLYQLQEFWGMQVRELQRLIALARPGAPVWATFLNAQASRMIARFLPPVRVGYSSLADPLRAVPNLDFASYLDFVEKNGGALLELWAMLDQNAQEFCQRPPTQAVTWETRGTKVSIGTFADAFLWGGSMVGIAFARAGGSATAAVPKISYSPYSSNLLQALVLPYPDYQTCEGTLASAVIELEAWKSRTEKESLGQLARFFLQQVGDVAQPRRALLMGAGWGRDLLLLKRHYPTWTWEGFEHQKELATLAQSELDAAGVSIRTAEIGQPLPFGDRSFDVVLSLGYFSGLYEPAARALAPEVRRVAKGAIYHLEDGRGPDAGMHLRSYSLKTVYADLGSEATASPVLVDGSPIGMYMLKLTAPA